MKSLQWMTVMGIAAILGGTTLPVAAATVKESDLNRLQQELNSRTINLNQKSRSADKQTKADAQTYTIQLVDQLGQPYLFNNGNGSLSDTTQADLTPGSTITKFGDLNLPASYDIVRLAKDYTVPDSNADTIKIPVQKYIDGKSLFLTDDSGKSPAVIASDILDADSTALPAYQSNYDMILGYTGNHANYPDFFKLATPGNGENSSSAAVQQKILNHYFTGIDALFANGVSESDRQQIINHFTSRLKVAMITTIIKMTPAENRYSSILNQTYQTKADQITVNQMLTNAGDDSQAWFDSITTKLENILTNDPQAGFNVYLKNIINVTNQEIQDKKINTTIGIKQLDPSQPISVTANLDKNATLDLAKNSATNINQVFSFQLHNWGYYTLPIHYFKDGTEFTPDNAPTSVNAIYTSPTSFKLPAISGYNFDKVTTKVDDSGLTGELKTAAQNQITLEKQSDLNYQIKAGIDGALNVYYTKASDSGNQNPSQPEKPTDPQKPTEPEKPTEPGKPNQPNNGKPFKVYAKTSINEYSSDTFTAKTKQKHYVAKKRVYAPIFTVQKVVKNQNGRTRYQLTNGNYITANQENVNYLYWQGKDYQQLHVIHPYGTYEYKSTKFAQKNRVKLHRQGETLKVKKVITQGLTTRYQLTNGNYISGNKQWIAVNAWSTPKKVQAQGAINVYKTANLTGKVKHYAAKNKQVFTIKGFDYSNGFANQGYTLRYKVAGGYISGNPKLVKIVEK